MSNIRLFFEKSLSLNFNSKLDKNQSHYLSKVMRINVDQSFYLFNQSGEWEAKVQNIVKGIVEFSIIKKLRSANNEKEIWLAFAPIKLNYLNLMIQKATEIGVNANQISFSLFADLIFFMTENSTIPLLIFSTFASHSPL